MVRNGPSHIQVLSSQMLEPSGGGGGGAGLLPAFTACLYGFPRASVWATA